MLKPFYGSLGSFIWNKKKDSKKRILLWGLGLKVGDSFKDYDNLEYVIKSIKVCYKVVIDDEHGVNIGKIVVGNLESYKDLVVSELLFTDLDGNIHYCSNCFVPRD